MDENIAIAMGDASRLMRRRFDTRARAIGVTRQQWLALKMLSRNEGINQGKLAELLEVEPISACRMVDRLEESGMVERRRDPADRRAWQIFLTEKSRPVIAQLRGIGSDLCEIAFNGIDRAERDRLMATLQKIHANLNQEETEAAHG